jgi:hypothetical protein
MRGIESVLALRSIIHSDRFWLRPSSRKVLITMYPGIP